MIGLDAGVLLALLEQGETPRSQAARNLLSQPDLTGDWYVHPLVLAEIARALEHRLQADRAKVADYLEYILHAPELKVEGASAAVEALARYRAGTACFRDYLLAALNRVAGCETTVAFARGAADSAGFTQLPG